jgi:hypothetical protein
MIINEEQNNNLDAKAQLLFWTIEIMGIVIFVLDTIFILEWSIQNQERFKIDILFLMFGVPCLMLTGILAHALWTLRRIKFQLSKVQVVLLLGCIVLMTVSIIYDAIQQLKIRPCKLI